jgi:hypothetical protein
MFPEGEGLLQELLIPLFDPPDQVRRSLRNDDLLLLAKVLQEPYGPLSMSFFCFLFLNFVSVPSVLSVAKFWTKIL